MEGYTTNTRNWPRWFLPTNCACWTPTGGFHDGYDDVNNYTLTPQKCTLSKKHSVNLLPNSYPLITHVWPMFCLNAFTYCGHTLEKKRIPNTLGFPILTQRPKQGCTMTVPALNFRILVTLRTTWDPPMEGWTNPYSRGRLLKIARPLRGQDT